MTTPKPVALPELPLKKFCVDGEAWAYTGKQMHAYALSAIAMHRAEVERLRLALTRIAELDPQVDSEDGSNEWGEASCFKQSQAIARAALKETP